MSAPSSELLQAALDQAFRAQMQYLFENLAAVPPWDDSDKARAKFRAALAELVAAYDHASQEIAKVHATPQPSQPSRG